MNKDELKAIFLKEYGNVFDENGEIRNCGREACRSLISKAEALEPGTYFGDTLNGFMNSENIKKLYNKMNK